MITSPGRSRSKESWASLRRSVRRERLAAYKYPRLIDLTAELPLGPRGKVLKRELAARYTENPASPASVPERPTA